MILLLGAIFNRIRGGWLTDLVNKTTTIKEILIKLKIYRNEEVQHVKDLAALAFSLTYCYYFNISYHYSFVFYLAMKLGASFGWGGYISAMIERKIDHDRDDVKLLDKWFRSDKYPVFSGWAALSLRGVMWSTSIYLAFLIFIYFGYESESGWRAKCRREAYLALKAKEFTDIHIKTAKEIYFTNIKWDKYGGRIVAKTFVDGNDLSQMLISNGLAKPYFGDKKSSWCD